MKAIETDYKGIKYRSRLEARWAIFFDALKLEHIYEPDCFVLSNNQKYTPDFYLPKYDLYVEIKPNLDWLKIDYHKNRYDIFNKDLIVLSVPYPRLDIVCYCNIKKYSEAEIVFCPNSKYEPFFFTGTELGESESLFEDDYNYETNIVRKHRFWN